MTNNPITPLIPLNPVRGLELPPPPDERPGEVHHAATHPWIIRPGDPSYRLAYPNELIKIVEEKLAIKLDRSSLCRLRSEGLPHVPLSKRRIRYDLTACIEWLIINRYRKNYSQVIDPLKLLASFGLAAGSPPGAA